MRIQFQVLLDKYTVGLIIKKSLLMKSRKEKKKRVLSRVWKAYEEKLKDVPRMETRRGNLNLRFAVLSVELYRVLLEEGLKESEAIEEINTLMWGTYKFIGNIVWLLGGRRNKLARVQSSMSLLRRGLFPKPDFGWEEISRTDKISGFNCTKCPIGAYFLKENLSDVCVQSICKLDHQLSDHLGVNFERTKTIANGDETCDFRWKL